MSGNGGSADTGPRSEESTAGDDGSRSEGSTAGDDGSRSEEGSAPDERPTWRRWILPVLAGAAVLPVLLVGTAFAAFYAQGEIPPPSELVVPEPTLVLDKGGEVVAALDPSAVRKNVDFDDLPDHVWQAILAAEDRDFFDHRGFELDAIARAFVANVASGRVRQGASTITQQYVEIAVEEVDRSYVGKLRELALAVKMERQLSKEQILEHYLNALPFGRGAVGIEAAAQTYFEKPARELDVNQAATLAGMIAAPSRFDPEQNPADADIRRVYALDGMRSQGWIDEHEEAELVAAGLPATNAERAIDFGPNAYYIDAVRRQLAAEFGDERDIFLDLEVTTELDGRLQALAQQTLSQQLAPTPYQGALVTVDPRDGGVRALVGGADYREQRFNAAVQGANQAGSAFKPFGLAAFVEQGNDPQTSRFLAPSKMEVDFDEFPDYEVSNFANSSFGVQTVRQATLTSTNVVYAQIAAEVGPEAVRDMAVRAGIPDDEAMLAVPSLVLGTADVRVIDMANAFATFAAGGVRHEPRLIRKVVDRRTGEILLDNPPESERTIDEQVASIVTSILAENVQYGTGTAADIGRPAAGKTGTTNDSRDAWFVGYVPQYVTAVWIGTLDNTPMDDITGGSIPAATWGAYMRQAVAPLTVIDLPAPDYSDLTAINRNLGVAPTPAPTSSPTGGQTSPGPSPTPPDPFPTTQPPPEPSEEPPPQPSEQPSSEPEPEPTGSDGGGGGGGGEGGGG